MKTKILVALLAFTVTLGAAPLTETTAVHARPDLSTPAITYLKAGTQPIATLDSLASTPAGWMAIELPGPFEGYVANSDMTKSLDVRPGAGIYIEPAADAAILTTAEKGDKTEITGLRGKWTQIHLEKKIIGYIRIAPAPLPPVAIAPATSMNLIAAGPLSESAGSAGKPAPVVDLGDGGSGALPRLFQGKLVSTRRPFAPRRPYDYQLNDDAGVRFAYLDTSKLLQTEQIDNYVDRTVVVYGTARNVPEAKGIVIQIESLQLQ